MTELKMYKWVICHDNEEWNGEFDKFSHVEK